MHGPTFMGNPLACSLALESINHLLSYDWKDNIKRIENTLNKNLGEAVDYDNVKDVRVLGAIGVIEMNNPVDLKIIQKQFVDEGIWLRPFGKLIYTMPPYIISDKDLTFLCNKMLKVIIAH